MHLGSFLFFFFNDTATTEIYTLSLHDALPIYGYRKLTKKRVRTRIGLGNDTVETFLYTPEEFSALMKPEFRLKEVRGLHVLYPPPRGETGSGLWWIPRALDPLEIFIETRFPFSHLGVFPLLSF